MKHVFSINWDLNENSYLSKESVITIHMRVFNFDEVYSKWNDIPLPWSEHDWNKLKIFKQFSIAVYNVTVHYSLITNQTRIYYTLHSALKNHINILY